ncbi:MAG: cyclic nucleotide-binding domain-containing protein, partial [Bacteroidota bacterium]
MISSQSFSDQGIVNDHYIDFEGAETISINTGETICHTHARVSHVYFLLEGTIEYYLLDELTQEQTTLIKTSHIGTIVGWELLTPTNRFVSHVSVTSATCKLLQIPSDSFIRQLTPNITKNVCRKIYQLLEVSIYKQIDLLGNTVKQRAVKLDDYFISQDATLEERVLLLRSSPFFGEFKEDEIASIAVLMERRAYEANELIYDQDQDPEGIFILVQGEVSIRRQEGETFLNLRSISTPGYIFGWSSTFGKTAICRASTEFKSSLYFIPFKKLNILLKENNFFGINFYCTLIWLIGNQLQLSYSWYESLLNSHNHISIKQLLDVNASRIPISSTLYTIPHLLKDYSTHELVFSSLHELHKKGTQQERHLSSICLDLLKAEERELMFLNRIRDVYQAVASGNSGEPATTRKICAKKITKVFELVDYHLDGIEHLPKLGGNIFIYNHLLNHPRYTLNNHFQLTLDSHFISGM